MDNCPPLLSESLVVQMEEDKLNIRPPGLPNETSRVKGKWYPAFAVNESARTRLKSFAMPQEPAPVVTTQSDNADVLKVHEKTLEGSSNIRKLHVTERRQLRAQLRGAKQQDLTPDVGTEDLQQEMESLRTAHSSHLTNVLSVENSRRGYPNDTVVEFSGEGVRPASSQRTSTDSETEISKNGDEVSLATSGSQTSEESRKVEKKLRIASSNTSGTFGMETEDMELINEAWDTFEKSWKWQTGITDEEKQNGYRFLDRIDEAYLGFRPRRNDKRRFLRAYPIVGPIPEARLGCNCPMPMTFSQWSFVTGFLIFFIGLGVGGYFYFDMDSMMS